LSSKKLSEEPKYFLYLSKFADQYLKIDQIHHKLTTAEGLEERGIWRAEGLRG
jgi:hypothetical protein